MARMQKRKENMAENKFTDATRLERFQRQPIRPLSNVSDYVVTQFPQDLQGVREGYFTPQELSRSVTQQLLSLDPEKITHLNEREKEVAFLDLLMLQAGVGNSGGTPPEFLTGLIRRLAQELGVIPTLSYEALIYMNPLREDPRTFSSGSAGSAEVAFYEGHKAIEENLRHVNATISESLRTKRLGRGSVRTIATFVRELTAMFAMETPDFAEFRGYFLGYPSEFKGPSGAWSHGIAILDILLSGDHLPEDMQEYTQIYRQYFTREGQQQIQEAREFVRTYGSLEDHATEDISFARVTNDLHIILFSFRSGHLKLAEAQIPGVTTGEVGGSVEPDAGPFLQKRRDRHILHLRKGRGIKS